MTMTLRIFRTAPLLMLLAACGGGGDTGGPPPVLEVVKWTPSGDNQTDTVNQTLPNVIRVKVTLDGEVTAGVTVTFAGGILGTPSMVTGSNGIATSTWTMPQEAGVQTVTATVVGAVGSPVTFHATALPGPAVTLLKVSGDGQAGDTAQTLEAPLTIQVVDAFGNGIAGRWTYWEVTGALSLAADSIITDPSGFVNMFAVGAHSEGTFTVTVTAPGLTGSPAEFTGAIVAEASTINVNNNFFAPDSVRVPAGSAIKWFWNGTGHSVASTGVNAFQSSDIEAAGYTYGPILFATPGVYTYECAVHSFMTGKVVVF
jgi:plastocyanin